MCHLESIKSSKACLFMVPMVRYTFIADYSLLTPVQIHCLHPNRHLGLTQLSSRSGLHSFNTSKVHIKRAFSSFHTDPNAEVGNVGGYAAAVVGQSNSCAP
jgi:hypothetical protein